MKRDYYTKTDAGRVFLWTLVVAQLLGAVFAFILVKAGGTAEGYSELLKSNLIITIQAMLAQAAFLIVYLYFNRGVDYKKASKINVRLGWQNVLICIVIAIICIFGFSFLTQISDEFLTYIGFKLETSILPLDNAGWLVLNIILLAAVPAVLEELVFRGIILNAFRKKTGDVASIFISAALFSLMHCSPQQTVFTFVFGIVLAFVVVKTGSVVSSMIIHFLNNAIAVIFMYAKFDIALSLPTWAMVLIAIAATAATFVAVYFLGKLFKNTDKNISIEESIIEVSDDSPAGEKAAESNLPLIIGVGLAAIMWIMVLINGLGLMGGAA